MARDSRSSRSREEEYAWPGSGDGSTPPRTRNGASTSRHGSRTRRSSRQTSTSGLLYDYDGRRQSQQLPDRSFQDHKRNVSYDQESPRQVPRSYRDRREASHYASRHESSHRDRASRPGSRKYPNGLAGGLYSNDAEKRAYISRATETHSRRHHQGNGSNQQQQRKKKRRCSTYCIITTAVLVLILLIIITVPAAVVTSRNKGKANAGSGQTSSSTSGLDGISPSSIPSYAQGTYLDPFTWYDTTDFNVTFTNATVGGLSLMGLNSTWNDNTRANANVPPLNQAWKYGTRRIHGMNLGGWLSLEPFITPSFFSGPKSIIDEWTLTTSLGPGASKFLEKHYATFVTEEDFVDMQAAGFDHVRISFSYWAVATYPGDPYVAQVSWRYLLRSLEWARKHGLRVNLDLHAAPGSQNGWNHSGRQGNIGWLNGPDGQLNADRTLAIHQQLTAFFAQPRYANLVTMYGVVNEPNMLVLPQADVLNWTRAAIDIVRGSGMPDSTIIVIGDGFLGIPTWHGQLTDEPNVLLDVHEYVVFNADQIALNHTAKLDFACQGWSQQAAQSMSSKTGFGNFICGEWSQADTDCATFVNNVGAGTRWQGTLDTGNASTSVLTPRCPTLGDPACDCSAANADPSAYSPQYKSWLRMFAEAQFHSFEVGWGSFYWTWKTENATQWSWQLGSKAEILPRDVTKRQFDCSGTLPDFEVMGLSETY